MTPEDVQIFNLLLTMRFISCRRARDLKDRVAMACQHHLSRKNKFLIFLWLQARNRISQSDLDKCKLACSNSRAAFWLHRTQTKMISLFYVNQIGKKLPKPTAQHPHRLLQVLVWKLLSNQMHCTPWRLDMCSTYSLIGWQEWRFRENVSQSRERRTAVFIGYQCGSGKIYEKDYLPVICCSFQLLLLLLLLLLIVAFVLSLASNIQCSFRHLNALNRAFEWIGFLTWHGRKRGGRKFIKRMKSKNLFAC